MKINQKYIWILGIGIFLYLVFPFMKDLLSPGSNVYSEKYRIDMERDTLLNLLNKFNANNEHKDSSYFSTQENPYFYYGPVFDRKHDKVFYIDIPNPSIEQKGSEIHLLSMKTSLNEVAMVNVKPKNKEEKLKRENAIKDFETNILDSLKITYTKIDFFTAIGLK
ncbi:hypothetical protein ACR777_07205 [Sphingobacterium spiritivorum]|uniref:hypothetical protein n=1 Tax=Sphingobacterium spiritivorum TaxID=258 RepID=UPI003DA47188